MMRFAKAVLPMRLQKCFRTIHPWPVVELMCQSPSSQWHEKQRPECLLNCVVMRRGHRWGAWLKVTRPRLDAVLLAKQKQAKYIFTKSSQRPQFSSVQLVSRVWLFVTPWTAACQAVHHQLPEPAQTHAHWVGDAIQRSHPLLSSSLPALKLSQQQGLSSQSVLPITWPKYLSFSFSISPSNEYSGLISCRIDRFDLLPVWGTLKSLL